MGKKIDKPRAFVYRDGVPQEAATVSYNEGTTFRSPEYVATLFGVHHRTVRQWIRQGDLKAVRIGGRMLRITDADINAFISKGKSE